jgi:PIN domain nuclease of toxin-antitoxin system
LKILLDTQIFLWMLAEPKRLGENAKSLLRNKKNQLYLSAASSWEISIKASLEKLPLPESPDLYISSRMMDLGILPLDIKHHHTFVVYSLALHHRDPFDRILIAQAIADRLHLISIDQQFRLYDLDLIWGFE